MNIAHIQAGDLLPDSFNVIVEIPANALPVKYEMDKTSGALFVDRFLSTAMQYPMNYGFVPHTLSQDGDPTDVLVHAPFPLPGGVVVPCRPIGLLKMEDEHGIDKKVVAVPLDAVCPMTATIRSLEDLPQALLQQTLHFFSHYKDLEAGKWAKVHGWDDLEAARAEIIESVQRYQAP
ncbi:inorganic diphosphatase [Paludibacterium sp. B53371]|uniref:inorganic diphosphatase n=1 Tax=Paludibacterium sp. B53371 TaxID=2806263 RepID=UPI001C05704A|nr:inorganic diphosphatase [Paludibacterium sp. B53371]